MTFKETLRKFFSREIFRARGRASRSEFWWSYLILVLIVLAFMVVVFSLNSQSLPDAFFIPLAAFSLYAFFANLMTGIRRMHDINLSGWWYGVPLVIVSRADRFISGEPGFTTVDFAIIVLFFVAWVFIIYLPIKRGDEGANDYGPDPLATE